MLVISFLLLIWGEETVDVAFPLQFTADLTIIAHLVPDGSDYPPRERHMQIWYDYTNKLARVDIEKGFEAAKTYIRRYDNKQEFMVRPAPIEDCKRSHLGEVMPFPRIPDVHFEGYVTLEGLGRCSHYIHVDYDTHIDVYMDADTGAPVQLIQSSLVSPDATPSPVLTYMYKNVKLAAPSKDTFALPRPYTYTSCDNQAGGFPYLHIFHYFVKF